MGWPLTTLCLLYRETEKDPFRIVVTTDFKNILDPLFFSFVAAAVKNKRAPRKAGAAAGR